MAPSTGSSHSFQKLKLDTSAPHKPVPSTFASIARHDSPQNGAAQAESSHVAERDTHYRARGLPMPRETCGTNGHVPYPDTAIAVSSGSEEYDIEAQFRRRAKSISFNHEVTLDSGNRLSMADPLPKPSVPESFGSGESKGQALLEMHMSQRRNPQSQAQNGRYPLLQTTVDELDSQYNDNVASLTSETTASPPEEARTPLDMSAEYLLPPLPTSSAVEFPVGESGNGRGRRNVSGRSKSYQVGEGDSILRRGTRRSSTRTRRSPSSFSPAASFLARYKNSDRPLKPTEPDDEGQAIGFDGEYIIGKQLGWGGFSFVKEVTSIEDGKRVVNAVKIVRKQVKDKSELENDQIQTHFDHEVEIWRFLRHPYILPLFRVYTTDFATFCITKLNKGGTLFDLVRDLRKNKKIGLPQHLTKRYTYQLASAMRYLHNDVQVVHRDIKLENCLLDMTGSNAEVDGGDVLLCDFGMADFAVSDQRDGPEPQSIGTNQNIGPGSTSTSIAGSLQYAAPELFAGGAPVFSPAADMWAFGVVVYALLTATLPFNEGLDAKTAAKIQKGEYDVDLIQSSEALQEGGLDDALDLVKGCLELDPERRWTINEVLGCSWLEGCMEMYEDVSRPWLAPS